MYDILRPIACSYGNFKEGSTSPLKGVPQSIIDSWIATEVISKKTLPPMPLTEDPSPQKEDTQTPEDTKRTTYERKRR